jgi:putative hemolysin
MRAGAGEQARRRVDTCGRTALLKADTAGCSGPQLTNHIIVALPLDIETVRLLIKSPKDYAARMAGREEDVRAAQRLRFQVFNLELNEGLQESFATGLDADPFDAVCDHLIVEHVPSREVVGTYRLQMGTTAAAKLGYYSAQEFDFTPFDSRRAQIIELGRACVHKNHRNLAVLGMLWKAIADFATACGGRYLLGCSSLTSQSAAEGLALFEEFKRTCLAPREWQTHPLPVFACPPQNPATAAPPVPKLLRAYLSVGAKICGPPAIDRQFKTIDFLTLLDLHAVPDDVRKRFLS